MFADEIYDKVLYDGNRTPRIASLADDVPFPDLQRPVKNYRSCGYRAGWMVVSGDKRHARDYIEGLNMLASMRCAPTRRASSRSRPPWAATRASTTWSRRAGQCRQRDLAHAADPDPGRDLRQAQGGALHVPAPGPEIYPIADDQQFAYELLSEEKVLIVQGTGLQLSHARPFPPRLPAARGRL